MAETRALPCSREICAGYQEVLLKMNRSNIDEIVEKFNADFVWADAYSTSQIVATVAGSRKNAPELIEFMTKISETRGYSALLSEATGILERFRSDDSVRDEICKAIMDGYRKSVDKSMSHDFILAGVREFLDSDAFPVREAVRALRPLMDAIVDPSAVRRGWGSGKSGDRRVGGSGGSCGTP
jgi:hypothetical protein